LRFDQRLTRLRQLLLPLLQRRRRLLAPQTEVVGALAREVLVGAEPVDLRRELLARALKLLELVAEVRLLALEGQRLIADLEQLFVLAGQPVTEREDLLVLLVQRLAQIEELSTRDAPLRARREPCLRLVEVPPHAAHLGDGLFEVTLEPTRGRVRARRILRQA